MFLASSVSPAISGTIRKNLLRALGLRVMPMLTATASFSSLWLLFHQILSLRANKLKQLLFHMTSFHYIVLEHSARKTEFMKNVSFKSLMIRDIVSFFFFVFNH